MLKELNRENFLSSLDSDIDDSYMKFTREYQGKDYKMLFIAEGEKTRGINIEKVFNILDMLMPDIESLDEFKEFLTTVRYYFRNFDNYRVKFGFKKDSGESLYVGFKNNALIIYKEENFLEVNTRYKINLDVRRGFKIEGQSINLSDASRINYTWLKDYDEANLSREIKRIVYIYKLFYGKTLDPLDPSLDIKLNIMTFILEVYGGIKIANDFGYYYQDGEIKVNGIPDSKTLKPYGYFEDMEIDTHYPFNIEDKIREIGSIIRENLNPDNVNNLKKLGEYLYFLKHQENVNKVVNEPQEFVKKIATGIINLNK